MMPGSVTSLNGSTGLGERRRTLDARASMAAEGRKRVQPAATNTHAAMVLTPARTMAAVAATATVVPVVFHQWAHDGCSNSCAVDDLMCL
jgi:hypothetical protein